MRTLSTARTLQQLQDSVAPGALPTLARCIGGPVLREIARGRIEVLREAFDETGFARVVDDRIALLDALVLIFDFMRRDYRCDYVYRTAITNKIYLGRHSPTTTTLLSELRVWRSKADLAMFNGTSIAYEIKTELDNLDRLSSQLDDYSSVFDRIFVVTSEGQAGAVGASVPDHVGVLVLTSGLRLATVRDALSNADHVRPGSIVDALRRDEIIAVTRLVTGSVPATTTVTLADVCRTALEAEQPRAVHDAMVTVLKKRRRLTRRDFGGVRPELVTAYLDTGLRADQWPALTSRLTDLTVGDVMADDGHLLPILPCKAV